MEPRGPPGGPAPPQLSVSRLTEPAGPVGVYGAPVGYGMAGGRITQARIVCCSLHTGPLKCHKVEVEQACFKGEGRRIEQRNKEDI